MNQRIGVNHFDCTRRRKGEATDVIGWPAATFRNRFRRREHEHWPQPLAAGHEAVAHRLTNLGGSCGAGGQKSFERFVNLAALWLEPCPESHSAGGHFARVGSLSSPRFGDAGEISPRSLRISIRRSAPSSLEWQNR